MSYRIPVLILLLALTACSGETPQPGVQDPVAATSDASQRLGEVVEAYFEEMLQQNPTTASFIGDNRYNDRYTVGISPEDMAADLDLHQRYLDALLAIDPQALQGEDRVSWDLFKLEREQDIEAHQYPSHLLPVSQMGSRASYFVMMGSGSSIHPFNSVKDYDDFLKRIDGFVAWADQAIINMREGVKLGVVQPRVLMEKVLPQLQDQVVEKVEDSMFWKPIQNMPDTFSEADRARLQASYRSAIQDKLVPVFSGLHAYIKNDYLPHTRDTVGLAALPNGEAWYAYRVRTVTTTSLTPEQIHQIGLDEVRRIQGEMHKVMEQVQFKGDLKEFFAFLNTDPQFYFDTEEQLIDGYNALRQRLDDAAPKLFSRLPRAGFEIRPVEAFRARSAAGGSYMSPSADGSRPGVFYVNTYDLTARPSWGMESLFLHEAIPGHHFQGALAVELDQLPRFRRFGGYTAYSEGWGLYAESLGPEMGMYQDPYQYFGALAAELWRAIRLVVDTGLHAKGWSRQDVLDFMYANTAVQEARAVAEAERYIAWPGQALAYKIGQLKIRELRSRAEQRLGDKFDIKGFHSQVLEGGELPLGVLEAKIDRWVTSQL